MEGHSETLQDHQEKIKKLTREAHDKEMFIDELERRLGNLERSFNMHQEGISE